jgi:hypothetical protein
MMAMLRPLPLGAGCAQAAPRAAWSASSAKTGSTRDASTAASWSSGTPKMRA